MSKNTGNTAFRRIDVDQFNEDNFKYDEQGEHATESSLPEESEISQFLNKGSNYEALVAILKNAPLAVSKKNQTIKEKALKLAMKVLLAIKSSQIDDIVSQLDTDSADTLMKYIYKGFEYPTDGSSGHLLIWHEKVVALHGVGSIMRVLTDIKRV